MINNKFIHHIKKLLLANSANNLYKLLTIITLSFFIVYFGRIAFNNQSDFRLLATHPLCVTYCNNLYCNKIVISGDGSAISCNNKYNMDCETDTGLASDCYSLTGGCAGSCNSGWQSSPCDPGYSQEVATVNCNLSDNGPCSNNYTCYRCTPETPCSCTISSCSDYIATGASCTDNYCFASISCGSCQHCSGTPGSCVADSPTNGTNGVCGSSDGGSFCSTPSSNLCNAGTASSVTLVGSTYQWTCNGSSGSCGGSNGSNDSCSATKLSAVNGDWSSWSACSAACGWGTQSRTCGTANACGTQNCNPAGGTDNQACYLTCCPADGNNGVCDPASDGGTFPNPPVALCTDGTPTSVTTNHLTYTWSCIGTTGYCGGFDGSDDSCLANRAIGPSYESIDLRDPDDDTPVAPDAGNINHTCDTQFGNNTVRFVVTSSDDNNNISTVQIRVGGQVYSTPADGTLVGSVATFNINFDSLPTSTSNIEINVTDSTALSTGWIDTGRDLKIWDCLIPVSGTLYDGSLAPFGVINCDSTSPDFATAVGSSMAYTLNYNSQAPVSALDKLMSVVSPDYTQGSNSLVWGVSYLPEFSNVDGGTPSMRVPNSSVCQNILVVDDSLIDPYSGSLSLVIDFASILNQEPWFQAVGAGVVAKNSITDNIPGTCVGACLAYVSTNLDGDNLSGIIAAESIDAGYGSFSQNNNLNISRNIIGTDYSYRYFYNEYYTKLNSGRLYSGDTNMSTIISDLGSTGVALVNGNLTIDTNNSLTTSQFLMVVVSGSITVDPGVNNTSAIYIADGNFVASGTADNTLVVNGTIYSKSNIQFTRGFTTASMSNTTPSVQVQYRPDFIFSMPGKLTKVMSGWREGI